MEPLDECELKGEMLKGGEKSHFLSTIFANESAPFYEPCGRDLRTEMNNSSQSYTKHGTLSLFTLNYLDIEMTPSYRGHTRVAVAAAIFYYFAVDMFRRVAGELYIFMMKAQLKYRHAYHLT